MQDSFGRWLFFGCMAIIGLIVVMLLWSVLLWLALAMAGLIVIATGFRVWVGWRRMVNQHRLERAEVITAEAHAQAALAEADKKRAEASATWQQIRLIPANYIGAMIDHPAQSNLYNVWTYKQEVSPALKPLLQPVEVEALPGPQLPGPLDLLQVLTPLSHRPSVSCWR